LSIAWEQVIDASCQSGVNPNTKSCKAGELCGFYKNSDDCIPGVFCINGICQKTLDDGCVVGGRLRNCRQGD
ncbi:20825_t:CDS:2, partial [Racocetra persica]